MKFLERFLHRIEAQTEKKVPVEIIPADEPVGAPAHKVVDHPTTYEHNERRPQIVPGESVPEHYQMVQELPEGARPIAMSILEKTDQLKNLAQQVAQIKKKADEVIKGIKTEGGYDELTKQRDEAVQILSEVMGDIDQEAEVVVARVNSFFFALVQKTKEVPQVMVSDKDRLEFVFTTLKEIDANLSRSVKGKLQHFVNQSTIIVDDVTNTMRSFPIPDYKREAANILISQITQDITSEINALNEVGTSALSDLYMLVGELEDIEKGMVSKPMTV